jgi:hypothetical protein
MVAMSIASGGCSSQGIQVKIAGGLDVITPSNVTCALHGTDVTVTGTITGHGYSNAVGITVSVFSTSGQEIGSHEAPLTVITGTQTKPLDVTVPVQGVPAYCTLRWGTGPPPGLTTG